MNQVLLKRTATPSKVPTTTDIVLGELAINTYDGKLFLKKNNGADAIVEMATVEQLQQTANGSVASANKWTTARNLSLTGDGTATLTAVDGTSNVSAALTLATVNSTVGTYGSASNVAAVTVNAKGLVTAAVNTPIAIATSQVTSGTFADARIAQSNVTQHQASLSISESQLVDGAILARVAGNETITGTWAFSNAVTGVDPTNATHLATKQYVDNIATGLDFKASVRTATTANITLSGLQTIDGVTLVAGDRVLVKDQTTGSQNGIYVVASGAWTRSTDADNTPGTEVTAGLYTFVEEGTANADTGWVLTTNGAITVGTTSLSFAQFTGLGQVTAGTGLTKSGSTISLATVADSGAGTLEKVTVDSYGRVTGTQAVATADLTALLNTTYQPLDGDLTSIAGLAGTTGLLKKTAANTWTLDTTAYITSAGAPVQSVAGRTGAVTLTTADISGTIDGGTF